MLENAPLQDSAEAPGGGPAVKVTVWLFGELAMALDERTVTLEFPAGFTAGDVVKAMGERLGQGFMDQVMHTDDEKMACLRIFVDGLPVEDLTYPLEIEGEAAEVEMILLPAAEGG
jgi:hypothetical protein